MKQYSHFKGFTLLELLAVITIIGILATISIIGVTNSTRKARDAKKKSDLQQIGRAIQQYYNDNGVMPDNKASGVSYANSSANFLDELTISGIVASVPLAVGETNENKIYRYYNYSTGYTASDYGSTPFIVLRAMLEGEKPSTTGYGGTRPFNDGNWCNKTATRQYCITIPY